MRGRLCRIAVHRAAAGRVVSIGRRIARPVGDAFDGGVDHGFGGERQPGAAAILPREDNRRPAAARHPGLPSRRLDDLQDRAHACGNILCVAKRCEPAGRVVQLPSGSVQVSRFDFDAAQPKPFRVLMLHDLSFADRRQRTARDFALVFVAISALLVALLFVLVAWLQLRRWVKVLIGDIRGKRFMDDAESPRASLPILSQAAPGVGRGRGSAALGDRVSRELDAAGAAAGGARIICIRHR